MCTRTTCPLPVPSRLEQNGRHLGATLDRLTHRFSERTTFHDGHHSIRRSTNDLARTLSLVYMPHPRLYIHTLDTSTFTARCSYHQPPIVLRTRSFFFPWSLLSSFAFSRLPFVVSRGLCIFIRYPSKFPDRVLVPLLTPCRCSSYDFVMLFRTDDKHDENSAAAPPPSFSRRRRR